jgi:hypothetical protein
VAARFEIDGPSGLLCIFFTYGVGAVEDSVDVQLIESTKLTL